MRVYSGDSLGLKIFKWSLRCQTFFSPKGAEKVRAGRNMLQSLVSADIQLRRLPRLIIMQGKKRCIKPFFSHIRS